MRMLPTFFSYSRPVLRRYGDAVGYTTQNDYAASRDVMLRIGTLSLFAQTKLYGSTQV